MAYSLGKLTKYKLLAKDADLASYLPYTRSLSKANFQSMLNRYDAVVVKPSGGSGGDGVMSVSRIGDHRYKIHSGRSKKTVTGLDAAYTYIKRMVRGRRYLVQRKINLARVDGRPFDVRVMVQRRKGSSWKITGKLAKIAGSGYMITNIARSKGRVVPLDTAVYRSNIQGRSLEHIQDEIRRVALSAVTQLHNYYPIRKVGLDIGLDTHGRVWIIEANFSPSVSLFRKLRDKSMYKRIIAYNRKRA